MKKLLYAALVGLLALSVYLTNFPPVQAAAPTFADLAFEKVWNRVDKPVQDLPGTTRGYTWGPVAPGAGGVTQELYNYENRKVEYFDKARLEVNNPKGDPNDLFYVTTGLLVEELVTGKMQEGDTLFEQFLPSQVQVAGDSNENGANAIAPTYASFGKVASIGGTAGGTTGPQANASSSVINARIDRAGTVSTFTPPEQRVNKGYDDVTKHNIPDVFVDYGNTTGSLWDGSKYTQGPVFFNLPLYIFGRPLTEAYWTRAVVAGREQDVLVQLFERRVLTYTPSNPAAYRVEMGNVGQHYYRWRYEQRNGLPAPTLLAKNIDRTFTAGNKIFWLNRTEKNSFTLLEYDPTTKQQITLKTWPDGFLDHHALGGPVSDGNFVVWSETDLPDQPITDGKQLPEKFKGLDITGKTEFDILQATRGQDLFSFALDGATLYYSDSAPGHTGFFARVILDKGSSEKKINDVGARLPLVKGGNVLYATLGDDGMRLFLVKLGETTPRLLGMAPQGFYVSGYDISGDSVVWAYSSPDEANRVMLYNINSGQQQAISPHQGYIPKINGNYVSWIIGDLYHPATGLSTAQFLRRDTGQVFDIGAISGVQTDILDSGLLVYTRAGEDNNPHLYTVDLNAIK